jgi:hypothetical protein
LEEVISKTRSGQIYTPISKIEPKQLSVLGCLCLGIKKVVEEVFNGSNKTLGEATGLSGCERRIKYHCNFLEQTGAWDQRVSIPRETKEFQVRGIIKQCFQERFPCHIWCVQEHCALKGHHVFPSRIILYARQLGLTISRT